MNRLIERLLKSPGSQRDLLTLGYSRLTGRHTGGMSDLHGIENHFPNTLVSYIKNPEWEALLCLYVFFCFPPINIYTDTYIT